MHMVVWLVVSLPVMTTADNLLSLSLYLSGKEKVIILHLL